MLSTVRAAEREPTAVFVIVIGVACRDERVRFAGVAARRDALGSSWRTEFFCTAHARLVAVSVSDIQKRTAGFCARTSTSIVQQPRSASPPTRCAELTRLGLDQ